MGDVINAGVGYAGVTAALERRARVPESDQVADVSSNEDFIFYPSLILLIQVERGLYGISSPVLPVLEEACVTFIDGRMRIIDPDQKTIAQQDGRSLPNHKILIATGGEWQPDALPASWFQWAKMMTEKYQMWQLLSGRH